MIRCSHSYYVSGSGVGLLGIALASAGAQIVLTDQKPMLPLLQQNVDSNITLNKYKVSVAELDWSVDNTFHVTHISKGIKHG